MKALQRGITTILVLVLLLNCAFAAPIATYGDSIFMSASCFIFADKLASFDFTTYDIKERIVIVNVWLEQQVNGQWVYQKTLPVPAKVATDTVSYCVEYDYSSNITGRGTFRLGVGFSFAKEQSPPIFFEPNVRGRVTNFLATDISKQGHFAKNDILLVGEILPNPR